MQRHNLDICFVATNAGLQQHRDALARAMLPVKAVYLPSDHGVFTELRDKNLNQYIEMLVVSHGRWKERETERSSLVLLNSCLLCVAFSPARFVAALVFVADGEDYQHMSGVSRQMMDERLLTFSPPGSHVYYLEGLYQYQVVFDIVFYAVCAGCAGILLLWWIAWRTGVVQRICGGTVARGRGSTVPYSEL